MGDVTEAVAVSVKRLRLERGWSAQRLANECQRHGAPSLTRGTIAKIESGVRKSVTADELAALAAALGVPAMTLLAADSRQFDSHSRQESWRVRVRAPGGRVCGSGILLPEGFVLTSVGVITAALGLPEVSDTVHPDGWVHLDFPFSADESIHRGRVTGDSWMPVHDLAVVAVEGDLPGDIHPARDWAVSPSAPVLVLGFPPGHELGVWARARVLGPGGPRGEWIELEGMSSSDLTTGPGFSGAAVVDENSGAVVAMVTAAGRSAERPVAWAITTETIARYSPPVRRLVGLSASKVTRSPLFFLSYADSRRNIEPNRQIIKFFNDLSEDVAQLVGWLDPGFMDRSMIGGVGWSNELLEAVGTCKVFVALLSDPYVISPWCSMEWHAFSQRKVSRHSGDGSGSNTGIIPVIWTPLPAARVPKAVAEVQRFSPSGLPDVDVPARYEAEGVYGLMRTARELEYHGVVWRLAQRIAEFHFGHEVAPLRLRWDDLRDIFREDPS